MSDSVALASILTQKALGRMLGMGFLCALWAHLKAELPTCRHVRKQFRSWALGL